METMGERIKKKREAKGWGRSDLAKVVPVTVQAIGQWEAGVIKGIRPANLLLLLDALEITLRWLVNGVDRESLKAFPKDALTPEEAELITAWRALPADLRRYELSRLGKPIPAPPLPTPVTSIAPKIDKKDREINALKKPGGGVEKNRKNR